MEDLSEGAQLEGAASRMLELIHDLGECEDSRQILVTSLRHFRVLFGDFWVMGLITEDGEGGSWRMLPLENPYLSSWGGVASHMLPEETDTDEILRALGTDISERVENEGVLTRALVEGKGVFFCCDDPLAVRLGAMLGLNCRMFWGAEWKRPLAGGKSWLVLGFADVGELDPAVMDRFGTAVEAASKMGSYPALVNMISRTDRINQKVRRNIVHDLKTPLTVIRGYAETLEQPDLVQDESIREELLTGIVESCDRLLEDIRDLLEPVGHVWEPQKEQFDMAILLHKAVLAERHTERSSGHEILLDGADTPMMVHADERKIRRVTENLLSNAVKYSPGTGKKVWIRMEAFEDGVKVSVRDEGIGMNEVQLAKVINEAGRVVDPDLGIEGTGFGLDSARQVLEAHGGRMGAWSESGEGSEFWFWIPGE